MNNPFFAVQRMTLLRLRQQISMKISMAPARPSRLMHWTLRGVLLAGLSSVAWAQNQLQDIQFNTLPGDQLQIEMQLTEPVVEPLTFTINDPARISVDLLDTENNLAQKTLPINLGTARSISTAEANGRTRVVLNMSELMPYTVTTEGSRVLLTLDNQGGGSITPVVSSPVNTTVPTSISTQGDAITDIDFRRGEKGEGRVIINLSDSSVPVDVTEEGNRLVLDFASTSLPPELRRRLDVLDFATPVKTIDTFENGRNTRIIVTPIDSNYEHLAYQSDRTFTLELKAISQADKARQVREKFGYTGERLSLNFQDIEVRSVLQLIADFTGLNVVVSDSVSGTLTLRLKNVPWDQALDIILTSKGLGQRKSGNVLLIAPAQELAAREKVELEALQQVQELEPLRSEFIQVNYASAGDLASLLSGSSEGSSLLSDRGRVTIDQRTNTLLLLETPTKLDEIRSLVTRLDIPVRQVLIESRIVVASDDFEKQLGVEFGFNRQTFGNNGNGFSVTNDIGDIEVDDDGTIDYNLTRGSNVNLGIPGAVGNLALALARLPSGTLLEMELSAAQAEGRGEIISSPRVITANQKEAFIEQGVEIPFQEASSSGATTISFKKAVLSLQVTPQITPDDSIIMDLTVNNDSVGEIFGGIPSIDTREVNTQVLVKNGETVVLGGIFEQETRSTVNKVPFFGDLPAIGRFFRNEITSDDKSELLIFVTPKIIRENVTLE